MGYVEMLRFVADTIGYVATSVATLSDEDAIAIYEKEDEGSYTGNPHEWRNNPLVLAEVTAHFMGEVDALQISDIVKGAKRAILEAKS